MNAVNIISNGRAGAAALLLLLFAQPWAAVACSVCYGEPDSPATRGLTWAIVALAMIVVGVLAGIVSFFVAANRQASSLADQALQEDR